MLTAMFGASDALAVLLRHRRRLVDRMSDSLAELEHAYRAFETVYCLIFFVYLRSNDGGARESVR